MIDVTKEIKERRHNMRITGISTFEQSHETS